MSSSRRDDTLHEGRPPPAPQDAVTEAIGTTPVKDGGEALSPTTPPEEVPEDLRNHPRYRLHQLLGKGGMGLVFKAQHRLMDRVVALKVIHQHLMSDTSAVERFRREVQAAARLRHPNIVAAYDAEQAGGTHLLVMEYVEGQTLGEVLQARGRLSIQEACEYARQVALGLEYAHGLGMVHRDIKPDNLMLSRKGVIKILDFGLARLTQVKVNETASPAVQPQALGENTQLTLAGSVMGTPDYLAPEQASGDSAIDIRADVYALGCTLFHLLTGQVPFPGGSTLDKLLCHLNEEPPSLRSLRADVPAELSAVVQRMMARDPARRYQSPAEAVAALSPFCQPPRRRRLWPAALALLLLLAALASFQFWWNSAPGYLILDSEVTGLKVIAIRETADGGTAESLSVTQSGEEFALPPGTYRLILGQQREDLLLAPGRVEIPSGGRVRVEVVRIKPGEPVAWKTFSLPDAQALAARSSPADRLPRFNPPKEVAALLHLPAGAELAAILGQPRFPVTDTPAFPSFSRDGGLVAVPSGSRTFLFRTGDGTVARILRGHSHQVPRAELSPDGRRVLTSSFDHTVRLWAVDSGEGLKHWRFTARPWGLQFSPRGNLVAVATNGGTFMAYDIAADRRVREVEFKQRLTGLAIHPLGKVAAVGLGNGQVRFVDLTGTEKDPVKEGNVPAVKVPTQDIHVVIAFDKAGTRMAVASDLELKAGPFDVDRLQMKAAWSAETGGAGLLAFTPDGTQLLASPHVYDDATQPHLVTLFAVADGKKVDQVEMRPGGPWGCYCLSPDGRWVAGVVHTTDRELTVYDLQAKRFIAQARRHSGPVQALAFSPDGGFLVSGGKDGQIKVWDLARGELHPRWPALEGEVRSLAFHPSGRRLASADGSGTVKVFSFPQGKELMRKPAVHVGGAEKLAFIAGGRKLVSAGKDARVLVIDPESGEILEAITAAGQALTSLVADATGQVLAAGSDRGIIQLWRLDRAKRLNLLNAHEQAVTCLERSADNRWLFSAGQDGKLRIWDFEKGTAKGNSVQVEGPVRGLVCGPDGRWLAASGAGGSLVLGDLSKSPPRWHPLRFYQERQRIGALAVSPEGRYLAAGMHDGTVHLIRLAGPGGLVRLPEQPAEPREAKTVEVSTEPVLFGNSSWSEYTIDLEAMVTQGTGEFGVMFHHFSAKNWCAATFGGWNNTKHGFLAARPQSAQIGVLPLLNRDGAGMILGQTQANHWHKVELEVRGTRAKAYLDGNLVLETAGLPRTSGRVGLRTQGTTAVFRRIVVRDLEGRVISRGPP